MQQGRIGEVSIPIISTKDVKHIDLQNRELEDINDDSQRIIGRSQKTSDDQVDTNDDNEPYNDSKNETRQTFIIVFSFLIQNLINRELLIGSNKKQCKVLITKF